MAPLRGQAFLARGGLAAAEAELASARAVARRLGNPPQRWKPQVADGDLRRARGDRAGAGRADRAAFAIIDRVAAQLPEARLRAAFLDSPHVRENRRRAGVGAPR
jgi:hypothetical protein